jgi:hypothetical protein
MNYLKKIYFVLLLGGIATLNSCTKEVGPLSDLKPVTPILVNNAIAYRPEPTVGVSRSAIVSPGVFGPIQIVLSVDPSSPRTIASITKVAVGTSYTQIQSTGTTGFYTAAPIPGSGKTATFTTSLTEYSTKTGLAITTVVTPSNTELARRFYFLVTLDDNSVVVTEFVRVLVFD